VSDHISTLHAESRTIAFEKIRSRLPLGVFIVFPLLRMCVLGVVLLLTIISTAWTADQTVTLRLGAGSALTLERPFKTVLVGDPNIVNVHTHSDRLVILEPLHPGETNLVFVDEESITIANIRIVVSSASAVIINYRDRIAFSFRSNSDIRKPCVDHFRSIPDIVAKVFLG
jgi:hypothetical protein